MSTKFIACAAAAVVGTIAFSGAAVARDQIQIAGSSTVLPYANIVAEQFGKTFSNFKTPIVESGGTGAGIKQFCQGLGDATIDIANSSRKIKKEEIADCAKNGVKEIVEVQFGYDGIVFAVDAKSDDWALEPKDLYLALAAEVPKDGARRPEHRQDWNEVNPTLPDWPIAAYIPGEKHGTREVFEEKVLHAGAKAAGADKLFLAKAEGADDAARRRLPTRPATKVRKDGAAVDIDGDYTETLARIASNPKSVGVFGLSFYENNADKLKVATVSGVDAVGRDDRRRQVSGVASAVLLREEGAPRRRSRPQGICGVLLVGQDDRPRGPARRVRPRSCAGRRARQAAGRREGRQVHVRTALLTTQCGPDLAARPGPYRERPSDERLLQPHPGT